MNDNDFDPNKEAPNVENTDSQSNEPKSDFSTEEQASEPSTDPVTEEPEETESASPEELPIADSDSDTEELHSNSEQPDSSAQPQTDYSQQPQQPQPPANPYQQQYNQWQQGNYYGQQPQYRPYGQNTQYQPYGQYNQYGQSYQQQPVPPQQPQNQNQNTAYEPYVSQNPSQLNGKPPKQKMNAGLKAFLLIIGAIAILFVLGFCCYGVYVTVNQGNLPKQSKAGSSSSQQLPNSSEESNGSSQAQGNSSGTNPNSSGLVIEGQPTTSALSAKDVYKKVAPSIVSVITSVQGSGETGEGSGIVATTDGYIITNAHVVNYSKNYRIKIILYSKKEYSGTVVGFDKTTDLAVIKIDANNLTPAKFGSVDNLSVGDQVLAIGNPGGIEFSSSLTQGIISALNRTVGTSSANGMTYIQTDAAINPGNSGGALVNLYGQVVGINSSKIVATGYEGMGFAIPISKAKGILDVLVTKGYVAGRTRLGISAQAVTEAQMQQYEVPQGVAIMSIDSDSSLKNSGVKKGDIITKADGKAVASMENLYTVLNSHKPNDTMTLTIYRAADETIQSKTFEVKIKLLEDKGETQGSASSSSK